MRMRTWNCLKLFIAGTLAFSQLSCGENFLMAGSEKDTEKANIYEAKLLIDAGNYAEALTFLNGIDSTGQAKLEVKLLYVSAYAGVCGMEFIPLFDNMNAADFDGGGEGFLKIMMNAMTDRTSNTGSCMLAYNKLLSIGGTYAARETAAGTGEPNMVMALTGLAQAGGVLRAKADLDNDNTMDGTFNMCTGLTDEEVKSVGVGVFYFFENITALFGAGNEPTVAAGIATAVSAICSNAPSKCYLGTDDFDDISTANTTDGWTAGEVTEYLDVWKDIIRSPSTGIDPLAGVCVGDACCP